MTKADIHLFDSVHDTQMIYRVMLDCMARPGKISQIALPKWFPNSSLPPTLEAIARTLLDREVSYHFIPELTNSESNYLKWQTFSVRKNLNDADFVFIYEEIKESDISLLMEEVKKGTLADPHSSATIILQVKAISTEQNNGLKITLSGPGIKGKNSLYVHGLKGVWLTEREKSNKEFPMGVDFFLVTEVGELIALPRTTMIEREGV